MDYEHVSFPESIAILSKMTGVKVANVYVKETPKKYDKYYKIYDLACKFYQNNILLQEGKEAIEYLHNRGITDEIIKTFIPKQPTDEELADYVTEVIKDYLSVKGGNLSMKDMKPILDIVKQKYASVNGRIVSKTLQKYIV